MAQRIIPFTVSTGAGITRDNPQITNLQFTSADVTQIDIMVPPGPSGFLGFHVDNGGGQYIPEGSNIWITPDDVYLSFPVESAPNNGNWQLVTYNNGNYSHTLYLFFHVNNLSLTSGSSFSAPIGL